MKLNKELENIISGSYYKESILVESKIHCSDDEQVKSLEGFINGNYSIPLTNSSNDGDGTSP